MFSWKEFEKSKSLLSHICGDNYYPKFGQHHLFIRPVTLLNWMEFIKDDLGFFTLEDISALEKEQGIIELVYHLLNMGNHQRINVHLLFKRGEVIPSVIDFFSNADWLEREQGEMFSLGFDRPLHGLILPEGQAIYPLLKKSQITQWPSGREPVFPKLRFNPNKSEEPFPEESFIWKDYDLLSPLTRGDFEFMVCYDPETVVDAKVRIGFHHQGLEKLLEKKDIFQISYLIDKINLSAAPSLSISWIKTIEEMLDVSIPERAQALRIVLLELARINDHLTVMALTCSEAEQDEFRLFLNAREKIYELFEKFSGHRQGLGICTIGGVKNDLPPGWIAEYQSVATILDKTLHLIYRKLILKPKFRELIEGEDVNSQEILKWGITGPAMRAAGLNFDLRKSQPVYFYQDIDFDIPVGIHGSGYDRFLIRQEEIFQSLRIITQVIDNLPLGAVCDDEQYQSLSLKEMMSAKFYGWHYGCLEAPGGVAGYLVNFKGKACPERVKIKSPSLAMAQALPVFLKGLTEKQIPVALASLGLSRWEMDR